MSIFKIACTLLTLAAANFSQAQTADGGKQSFQQCVACHSLEQGKHSLGPSLYGTLGQRAGTTAGFRFSGALKNSGIIWNRQSLEKFLADPQAVAPGNRMPFSGVANDKERRVLISYLETVLKSSKK